MNMKPLLAAVVIACSTIVVGGCAHHSNSGHARTAGDVVDDSMITTRVKSELLAEKDLNSFDIKVKTLDGRVQLSGFVSSQWQIDKAVMVTRGVAGVVQVQNDLIRNTK
ncbi:MAG TPA: BON domain-containing protein [Pseudomonadales bacterium]|nr:BON domain-containing protein [Pseudomonadales bacterium]